MTAVGRRCSGLAPPEPPDRLGGERVKNPIIESLKETRKTTKQLSEGPKNISQMAIPFFGHTGSGITKRHLLQGLFVFPYKEKESLENKLIVNIQEDVC